MKMKKYFFGIIAFAAIVAVGFVTYKDYHSAVYVAKSYSSDLQALGYASGAAEYYRELRADENGNIDIKDVQKSRDAVYGFNASKNGASGIYWEQMGPNYVGGRTRALLQDNKVGSRWYAGGVNGGVFITHDGGNTWHEFNSSGAGPDLSVSSFAQSPNGVLFVATGCEFEDYQGTIASSGTPGNGLFRVAVDVVTGTPTYTKISEYPSDPNSSGSSDWRFINRIRANPVQEDKLYVGTKNGLFITNNAHASEVTFFTPTGGLPLGSIDDFAVTSDGKEFWVAAGAVVAHFTDNGGEDVVEVDRTILTGSSRICLEIAPTNDNVLYAATVNSSSCLNAIYQSRDKGASWTVIGQGGSSFDPYKSTVQCQGIYDNALAVDATNEGRIIVGGISLWEWNESLTTPGTGGWTQIAVTQDGGLFDTNYVHADKHRIVVPGNGEIWVASDGGIGKSIDDGKTWFQANGGYNVTQFYSVSAATGVPLLYNGVEYILEQVLGGAQDNGTQLVGLNPTRPFDAQEISGGDGFDCAVSNISGVAFSTYTNGILYRSSRNGGTSFIYDEELLGECTGDPRGIGSCFGFHSRIAYFENPHVDMTLDSVKVYAKSSVAVGDTLNYYSDMGLEYLLRWPSYKALEAGDSIMMPDFAQGRLLLATNKGIYMSRDAAKLTTTSFKWDRIAGPESVPNSLSGGGISDMKFTADGNQIYVVTKSGDLYRIDNVNQGNDSLSLDIRSGQSVITCTRLGSSGQSGYHGRMAVDPNDPGHVVLTMGDYSKPYHVFEANGCDDALSGTISFKKIQGDLPAMPVYCAIIAEHDSKTIMVGTEFGVYMTENGGTNWLNAGGGLPKVPVYDMFQHTVLYPLGEVVGLENKHFRKIYLGTFGRGFYGSTGLVGIEDKNAPAVSVAKEAFELNIYPNPVHDKAMISLDLSKEENLVIEVYDLTGKIVSSVHNGSIKSGKKLISLDVSSWNNGTYLVSARSQKERKTTKLVVIK